MTSLLRRLGIIVPLAVLASLVALDIALGPQTPINGAYAIAAVAAATLATVRLTVVIGLAAVTLSMLSGVWNDTVGSRDWLVRWLLCLALVGLSVAMAAIRAEREK